MTLRMVCAMRLADGSSRFRMMMRVFTKAATLGLLLFVASSSVAAADLVLARVRFPNDKPLIVVPVSLAGKQYNFLLDSGTSQSVYGTALREHLGSPLGGGVGYTTTTPVVASTHRAPLATIGGVIFHSHDAVVSCISLEQMSEPMGLPVHGIVGMDFLRTRIIDIDFDNGTIRLLRYVPDELKRGSRRLPMRFDQFHTPTVNAAFAGDRHLVRLDTGDATTGHLDYVFAKQLNRAYKIRLSGGAVLGGAGRRAFRPLFRCSELSLGGFTHRNLVLSSNKRQTVGDHSRIGLGLLRRYRLVLDFPNQTLYLSPSREHSKADYSDLAGMILGERDGNVVVFLVLEGSTASRLGIREADTITAIAGRKPTWSEANRLIRMRDGEIVLRLHRVSGDQIEVTLPK